MSAEPEADRGRPTLSGDLSTVLEAAPMFRRALVGYDRFQVDTYVRWVEDELATAERERQHLEARQFRAHAELEEARELLSHSPGGADLLQLSHRMGAMLATAADDAAGIRADAEAEAQRVAAEGERALAEAAAEAARIVAEAGGRAGQLDAEACHVLAEAVRTRQEAQAETTAQRKRARAYEQRAVRNAERLRQRAAEEAAAARLQARDDVVRLLTTGREERRRADDAAAATRERLDADAAARRAWLLDDVERLEHRRARLQADLDRMPQPVPAAPDSLRRRVRGSVGRIRMHSSGRA